MQTSSHPAVPPGPRGWPIVGILPRIWRDPLRFFSEVARDHGDIARIGLGRFTLYLVSGPDAIDHVLHANARNYWKGKGLKAASTVMGQGLATSEGELWERQHRLIQPAFRPQQIASYVPAIHAVLQELLARWSQRARQGRAFDAVLDMRALALQVMSSVLFDAELDEASQEAISRGVTIANEKMNRSAWNLLPFLDLLPTPFERRFRGASKDLDAAVYRRITAQRQSPADRRGLLGQLVGALPPVGDNGSDRQIRDEVVTLFIAGVDTPAHALSWTIHLLASHPDWADRAAAEADDALSGDAAPSWDALERLDLCERIFKESMRLYPPAWMIVRTPFRDDVIGGYRIPAGAPVLLSQYVVHRHPAHWDRPDVFDPERWTPERSAARHKFAYFPFGGGSRFCVAQGVGMLLGKWLVARAAQEFRWEPAGSRPVVPQPLTTLKPRHGIPIRVVERKRGVAGACHARTAVSSPTRPPPASALR